MSEPHELSTLPAKKNVPNASRRVKLFHTVFWWVIGSLHGLIAILIGLQLFFSYYTDEIIGRALKEAIVFKSKGLYRIDYDEIRMDFVGREIKFSNLALIPNKKRYEQLKATGQSKTNLFEGEFEEINIKGFELRKIYFDKRLELSLFEIKKPSFSIISDGNNPVPKGQGLKIDNFYFLISGFFDHFQINDFHIQEGAFTYNRNHSDPDSSYTYTVDNIYASIQNFLIDSTTSDQKPFYIDDLEINVQHNVLEFDSLHKLSIADLHLSTSEEEIALKDIIVESVNEAENAGEYHLNVPKIELRGLNFQTLYLAKQLEVDTLQISNPILSAIFGSGLKSKPKNTSKKEFDLYTAISKQLQKLQIGHILLDSVQASLQPNRTLSPIKLNDLSIDLENFLVDSVSENSRKKKFYIDHVSLELHDFQFDLPDSVHTLQFQTLATSTKNQNIDFKNIRINPRSNGAYRGKYYVPTYLNIKVPSLGLKNIDLWTVYFDRSIQLGELALNRPSIYLNSFPKNAKKNNKPIDIDNLYPLIDGKLKYVKVSKIRANQGNFLLRQHQATDSILELDINRFDLVAQNFDLNNNSSTSSKKLLYCDDILVNLYDYSMSLPDSSHKVNIEKISTSLSDSLLAIRQIVVTPKYNQETLVQLDSLPQQPYVNLSLEELELEGINYGDILKKGVLDLQDITFSKPSVSLFLPDSSSNSTKKVAQPDSTATDQHSNSEANESSNPFQSFLTHFALDSLKIDSANVEVFQYNEEKVTQQFAGKNINTTLKNLAWDSTRIIQNEFFMDLGGLEYQTENYHLLLPDSLHELTVRRMGISAIDSCVFLDSVAIFPRQELDLKTPTSIYEVQFPRFQLDGIDVNKMYYEGILEAKTALLETPKNQLLLIKKNQVKSDSTPPLQLNSKFWNELAKGFPPSLKGIKLENIQIKQAGVDLLQLDTLEGKDQKIHSRDFTLEIKDFALDSTIQMLEENLLFSKEIEINIENYQHTLPNRQHTVEVRNLKLNTLKEQIRLDSIFFYTKKAVDKTGKIWVSDEKPQQSIFISSLLLDSVNMYDLLVNNQLKVKSVQLISPEISLVNYTKNTPKDSSKKFTLNLVKDLLQDAFEKVEVEKIQLIDGQVTVIQRKRKSFLPPSYVNVGKPNFYLKDEEIPFWKRDTENYNKYVEDLDFGAFQNISPPIPMIENSDINPYASSQFTFGNISTTFENFKIDSLTQTQSDSSILFTDAINFTVDDVRIDLPDTTYAYEIGEIQFSSQNHGLAFGDIKIIPQVSKEDLSKNLGHQTDWMKGQIEQIKFNRFDYNSLIHDQAFKVGRIDLDTIQLELFRDKNYPFPEHNRPPMPQDALRELGMYLKLDSIYMNHAAISYQEKAADASREGELHFDRMNVKAFNITNDSALLQQNIAMLLEAKAYLMDSGFLEVQFNIPLNDPNNTYTYEGELKTMALPIINPMLENTTFLKIESGTARNMRFKVQSNNEYATGKMKFLYKDLSVSVLNKTYNVGLHERLLTFLANTFLIRANNEKFFLFYKDGKIYAEKDPSKAIFAHWAQTLLSGVKSSITNWSPGEGKERLKEWEKEQRIQERLEKKASHGN